VLRIHEKALKDSVWEAKCFRKHANRRIRGTHQYGPICEQVAATTRAWEKKSKILFAEFFSFFGTRLGQEVRTWRMCASLRALRATSRRMFVLRRMCLSSFTRKEYVVCVFGHAGLDIPAKKRMIERQAHMMMSMRGIHNNLPSHVHRNSHDSIHENRENTLLPAVVVQVLGGMCQARNRVKPAGKALWL
jgi:hypothetical protein